MLYFFKKYLDNIIFAILLPFGWFYGIIIWIRNLLYDYGIKTRYIYNTKVISVGNIRVGGTGKTPCIEYLVGLLQHQFYIMLVSRGYKRATRGFRIADKLDTARTIGDEPYQLYKKFAIQEPKIQVIVGENRAKAIKTALEKNSLTEVILLDDGFQHRQVDRQLNILLTSFHQPFFKDYLLPIGRLREPRRAATRADIIIVTKCPANLSNQSRKYFVEQIKKYINCKDIPILFTYIDYGNPINLWTLEPTSICQEHIMLLTGIADPVPMVEYVHNHYQLVKHIRFGDHHRFNFNDIEKIVSAFHQITYEKKCILTTEKDSMRLMEPDIAPLLKQLPIFWLPISMCFMEGEDNFKQLIFDCIKN